MGNRIPLIVLVSLLAAVLAASCQSTPPAEESAAPEKPSVQTAGWESAEPAAPAPAPSATDRKNAELEKEIEELKEKVRQLSDHDETRADEKVLQPEPARVVDMSTVRQALRDGGVEDMTVSRNADGEIFITLPGSVSFGAGKASLMPSGKERLRSFAGVMKAEFPAYSIRVEGHTDSDPIKKSKWESNSALSAARAQAVAAYLVKECSFASEIQTTGFGATRPITDNDTREGKARNRRIELVMVSRTR